jgi:hypothetical protein
MTEDGQRLGVSAICALALHLLLLAAWGALLAARTPGFGPVPEVPLILNLRPELPRQLVDTHTPAEEPVEDTDLISDIASKATDRVLRDGESPGPQFEEFDELESLATPAPPPEPPAAAPEPPALPPRDTPAPAPVRTELDARQAPEQAAPPEAHAEEAEEMRESEERMHLAQALPQAPESTLPRPSKGHVHDAVRGQGFAGFEAMQSEIAPYLKEVRRRVELRWNEMLLMRYSGTKPVKAIIDCAIAPDGSLASVEVVGVPEDPVYAALCRQAITLAGPFGPFPFQVPEMYREKNLEIRWTFSFL